MTLSSNLPHDELYSHFMRLCLRGRHEAAAFREARALAARSDFDWETLYKEAARAFLTPLLLDGLRSQNILPAKDEARWQKAALASAQRNLVLLHQLTTICGAFEESGIPVIALKGAALTITVYPTPALRPMRDLDLLIQPQDARAAQECLSALGYEHSSNEPRPGAQLAFEIEGLFVKPGSLPVQTELHWSLIDAPYYQARMNQEWFWETARSVTYNSSAVRVLGNEAQLLYTCAHLWLHHRGDELLWLNDAVELIVAFGEELDWDALLNHAAQLEWTIPLRQTLVRLQSEWGTPLPAAARRWLESSSPSSRENAQMTRIRARGGAGRRFWNDLTALPHWDQRARFAWAHLFPSRAYMRERYELEHPAQLLAAYPQRWWRGVASFLHPRR